MKKQLTAALIAATMTMGVGSIAIAQQAAPQSAPPAAPAANAADFKNAELEKFAAVQKPLQEIRSDYSERLQSTQEPNEAAELQKEATDKMMEIVQGSGLPVEKYNQIAVAMQSNPELQAKVQSMMN